MRHNLTQEQKAKIIGEALAFSFLEVGRRYNIPPSTIKYWQTNGIEPIQYKDKPGDKRCINVYNRYSINFKIKCLKLIESGNSIILISNKFKVKQPLLSYWVKCKDKIYKKYEDAKK